MKLWQYIYSLLSIDISFLVSPTIYNRRDSLLFSFEIRQVHKMGSSQALALVLQLGTIDKKIKKLNQIWAKFKATPTSIILLLKDLTILISTVIAVAVDNGPSRDHPVIVTALNELSNTLQHLQDLSGKYTSRFGRKPLTSDNLHQFELCLTDGKIRLLLIQFLLER